MRNSWLKLCIYINYSWFPSRKHTQVLRFFQSHDHMIYSKRGADLVWKNALLHKCEILEELYQRLVPEKETRPLANKCDHMEQCGIPPFPVQSEPALTPIREWCLFSLLPFPQPHWGDFLSLEMEHFWPSSTGPNVPPGCNGCCMLSITAEHCMGG